MIGAFEGDREDLDVVGGARAGAVGSANLRRPETREGECGGHGVGLPAEKYGFESCLSCLT